MYCSSVLFYALNVTSDLGFRAKRPFDGNSFFILFFYNAKNGVFCAGALVARRIAAAAKPTASRPGKTNHPFFFLPHVRSVPVRFGTNHNNAV